MLFLATFLVLLTICYVHHTQRCIYRCTCGYKKCLLWLSLVGLYRHHKGGLYIVVGWCWESGNNLKREVKVTYISLGHGTLNVRRWPEFFGRNSPDVLPMGNLGRLAIFSALGHDIRFRKLFPGKNSQEGEYQG